MRMLPRRALISEPAASMGGLDGGLLVVGRSSWDTVAAAIVSSACGGVREEEEREVVVWRVVRGKAWVDVFSRRLGLVAAKVCVCA